jgi:deoxyribodipyrimidine photo-lyase
MTSIALFTRDLRVHDNPVLAAAAEDDSVVPLFVLDDAILGGPYNRPNRAAFLADSLADLDRSLRGLGGGLVVRRGDVAAEVARLADEVDASEVHVAADYSRHAVRRQDALARALGRRRLVLHASHVVAAPGEVTPSGADSFSVFSPYHRRWVDASRRPLARVPDRLRLPNGVQVGTLPTREEICPGDTSPELMPGGERSARQRVKAWFDGPVADYGSDAPGGEDGHNDLGYDGTSRLSPYLHFGCLSANEIVARADRRKRGVDAFLRQLAWRDFYTQVLAVRPDVVDCDLRTRGDRWRRDDADLQTWKDGRTGYPVVDAGMRQLAREGWMHNRARLVTASFLTKHLYLDWRPGMWHFFDLLQDGDIANNALNWQWVAGTGTDSRPNRMLNPTLQQQRYDPDFAYVRKYVPEFGTPDYPPPMVDHREAVAAFRAARSG